MRKKKPFRIVCFYCKKEFILETENLFYCKRAYCDDCSDEHKKAIAASGGPAKWRLSEHCQRYHNHLEEQKFQACIGKTKKEKIHKFLVRRNGKLFREEEGIKIELGKIKGENKDHFFVQKGPFDSIVRYSKEVIINGES